MYYEPAPERRRRVGRLALVRRELLFEYDATFIATGLELSPFRLPLAPGVIAGKPDVLDGMPGVFDDSLPDGWGKLLMDRRAAELGLTGLTALDRLALVGARSMGALTYEPEVTIDQPAVVSLRELEDEVALVLDGDGVDLEKLIAIGGSPKGARPKALIQIAADGRIHYGARAIEPGFTAWMVKFRGAGDDAHAAALEHAYFLTAAAAGIAVPHTRVLGKTKRHAGYFAIERFDRRGDARIHMHTLGGLYQLPHGYPTFEYADLLTTTRALTRDEVSVREMFRRACFNVLAHNRDDHARNFAFLMDERGEWRPSPAYDLTFSTGPGGEHTMLVAGEGRAPTREHLERVAERAGLKQAGKVLDEVRAAIARFPELAERAEVPAKLRRTVASALGLATTGARRGTRAGGARRRRRRAGGSARRS
ncbi:MAG: type II toxin-antitoxin system HipA family toxin [Deltaproteobacteria bacterium]|nr:type II toxin-antitoxin system HipA family toxin [Deltaproteobacteria bacterium]